VRLEKIALINIKTHFWRLILLLTGLTVVVATIVALYILVGKMNQDFQNKLDEYGTNIVITPKTEELPLSYSGVNIGGVGFASKSLSMQDIDKLKTIKNRQSLAFIAPKLVQLGEVNKEQAVVVGVDFKNEYKVKKWWKLAAGRKATKKGEAVAGAKLAQRLSLKVGQSVKIGKEALVLTGILEPTATSDDEALYINLQQAQHIFKRHQELSMIEVAAWCYNCPIETIVGQASEKLPYAKVTAVLQVAKTRNKVVEQFKLFAVILSVVLAVIGSLIVFTNTLTAVRERRGEIGVFRAIGFRRLNILEIILFEALIIAFVAGTVGYLAGQIGAVLLAPMLNIVVPVGVSVNLLYFSVLWTLLLTLVSSLYPALVAANLSPVEAINAI